MLRGEELPVVGTADVSERPTDCVVWEKEEAGEVEEQGIYIPTFR